MEGQTRPDRPGLPEEVAPVQDEDPGLIETLRWTLFNPKGCLVEVRRNKWVPLENVTDQKRVAQVLISQIRQYLEERSHIRPGQRLK
jgi:hypothetical protein